MKTEPTLTTERGTAGLVTAPKLLDIRELLGFAGEINEYESLYEMGMQPCVFIPKCRRKAPYRSLCKPLGSLLQEVGAAQGMRDWGGALMVDHVHMLISIPRSGRSSRSCGM